MRWRVRFGGREREVHPRQPGERKPVSRARIEKALSARSRFPGQLDPEVLNIRPLYLPQPKRKGRQVSKGGRSRRPDSWRRLDGDADADFGMNQTAEEDSARRATDERQRHHSAASTSE